MAIESPRGWRIAKEKASKKIDSIVALSMACAIDRGRPPDNDLYLGHREVKVETKFDPRTIWDTFK